MHHEHAQLVRGIYSCAHLQGVIYLHLYLVRDVDVCTHLVAQRRVGAHQVVGFNTAHTKPEGNLKEYQTCPGDYVQFESAISLAHIVTLSLPHQYPLRSSQ